MDLLEKRIREKLLGQHFMHHCGIEILKVEEGYIEATLEKKEMHLQHFGLLHGGVSLTLADICMGFAAYTLTQEPHKVVTVSLQHNFLRPGKEDKFLAKGRVIKKGSRLHYCEAEIFEKEGEGWTLIGKATSTMAVV